MKRLLLLASLFFFANTLSAQALQDSVVMGPNYTNDIFYSMSDGIVKEVAGNDWTVGFYNEAISAAIMLNGGRGIKLYKVSDDVSTFSNVLDTSDAANWDELHDDFSTWSENSAFEDQSGTSASNYGWGEYNFVSHEVQASRVFALQTISEQFYKVMVVSKIAGEFTFRYASFDNAFDTTFVITTPDYLNKNYAYLNMENHTLLDLEPNNTTWDIQFTKYVTSLGPTTYYPVTGVLSNAGVEIVRVENIPTMSAEITDGSYSDDRNTIGYDWKSFDNAALQFALQDSLSFFVKTVNQDIYKLYFTAFEGGSTGKVGFTKELVQQATSINELNNSLENYTVYPNPTKGQVELLFDTDEAQELNLNVVDLQGRTVINSRTLNVNAGLNAFRLDLSNQTAGVYFIQLNDGKKQSIRKIILQK